ncbi:hypothetical protein V2J09_020836 [Rumex salicifolius]
MAETVVLPFAKIILGQLAPLAIKELKLALGLEDEVDRIKSNLSSIQAVLRDAEKQQTTSESIKNWLSNLHDVMYDIDDLLDDITTEIKLHKMNEGHWSKQVRNFFSRTNSLFLRFQWAHQIKSLCKKLDRIAEERKNFVLSTESVDFEDYRFRETHSKLNKPELILGREDDKEAIINSVLSCMDCDGLSVVPVVGIGGLGKTTLAQMVYNDARIDDSFDQKLWVYVSSKLDLKKVIKQVISTITGESISLLSMLQIPLESLRIKMTDALKDKKYMLVLDDLGNEDSNEIDDSFDQKLWVYVSSKLDLKKVMKQVISTITGESISLLSMLQIPLESLRIKMTDSLKDKKYMLRIAFKDGERIDASLLNLAIRVVEKSCGLPLLVTTLGSLLRGKKDERELCRVVHELEQGHDGILNILKLSYDQLPSYYKRCFRSLSSTAKGACAQPMFVILPYWMALGFIQSDDEGEDDGRKCIAELLSNYLCMEEVGPDAAFIPDMARDFYLHDLVQDLATSMAREETVLISSSTYEVSNKTRYVSLDQDDLSGKQFPKKLFDQAKKTRLLAIINPQLLSKPFLETIISSLPYLRMLFLGNCDFEKLPRTIGYMKHLRYISLEGNMRIRYLPNSICNLINLQTLVLIGCINLQELPTDIGRLENLKLLFVTTQQVILPEGIGHIKGLKKLCISDCSRLAFLPMSIFHLENLDFLSIKNCEELDFVQGLWLLEGLSRLQVLVIGGLPKFQKLPKDVQDLPLSSLKYLSISNCEGLTELGDWINQFTSLTTICIEHCPNLVRLFHTLSSLDVLERLLIRSCPLLSERYSPEKGDDWHLISNISHIIIDDQTMIKDDIKSS